MISVILSSIYLFLTNRRCQMIHPLFPNIYRDEKDLLRLHLSNQSRKVYLYSDGYHCTSSTKSGQMRVKREERVLPTLDPLKNMTFPAFKH